LAQRQETLKTDRGLSLARSRNRTDLVTLQPLADRTERERPGAYAGAQAASGGKRGATVCFDQ
jgi:hypothetical protein